MKPEALDVLYRDVLRKEKPLPVPKPPAKPPVPAGVRVPGNSGSPGGMVCSRLS